MEHSGGGGSEAEPPPPLSGYGDLALNRQMHTPPPMHTSVNNQWFADTIHTYSESARAWSSLSANTSTSNSSTNAWPISSWQIQQQMQQQQQQRQQQAQQVQGPQQLPSWQETSSLSRDAPEDWPVTGEKIQRWQDTSYNDASLQDLDDGMEADTEDSLTSAPSVFTSPISMSEYEKQSKEYTQAAVAQLLASPEYKRKHTTCGMCWSVWVEGQSRGDCFECGGFALERPCPICEGRCGAEWSRDVDLSHSNHEAHWDGKCRLPWDQQQGFILQKLRDEGGTEEDLVQDFQDLKSS